MRAAKSGTLGQWGEGFGGVGQHGQPHGDVEPVQVVLGQWVEVSGQVAHVLAAVGEEDHRLVGLHALGREHVVQASPRLGLDGLCATSREFAGVVACIRAAVTPLARAFLGVAGVRVVNEGDS